MSTQPLLRIEDNRAIHSTIISSLAYQSNFFIAGAASGQPLDTVKSKIQAQLMKPNKNLSEFRYWFKTFTKYSIVELYSGSTSRIMAASIGGATIFGLNNSFKTILKVKSDNDIWTPGFIAAAALTGVAEAVLYTPFEAIKLHMQLTDKSAKTSVLRAFMDYTSRGGGVTSLYRGFSACIMREVSGNVAYFTTYQLLKKSFCESYGLRTSEATNGIICMSGGVAGIMYWVVAHPLDTVKSLLQTDDMRAPKYKGAYDCIYKVSREKGTWQLFRGFSFSLVRAFPANAACFLAYEGVLSFLV